MTQVQSPPAQAGESALPASPPSRGGRGFRLPTRQSLLDFGLIFGGMAFATAAGFILKVLIGRGLGDTGLGIFAMCYPTLTVTTTLGDVGIRHSLITLASRTRAEDPVRAQGYVAAGLLLKLVTGIVVMALGWVLAPWAAEVLFRKPQVTPYLQITAMGFLLWGLWDGVEGSLQSSQRFRSSAILRVLLEGTRLTSFLVLWLGMEGRFLSMDRFLWLYFLAPLLAVLIGSWLLNSSLRPRSGQLLESLKRLVAFAPGVFFFRTATMALLFLDSLALARYGELSQVGQYEAAKGLAYAILVVSESLGMVLLPKVNLVKTREAMKAVLRRFMVYFAILAVAAALWLSVAGALLALFGPAFTRPEVVRTFQILVVATLFTIPATTLAMVMLALGQPGLLGRVAAAQVLLGLFTYPVTVVQFGMVGTALTTVGLQLLGVLALVLALRPLLAGGGAVSPFPDEGARGPA